MNKDINQIIREQKAKENRLKLNYVIWSVVGAFVVACSIYLNIKKAGDGLFTDMLIAYFIFTISQNKLKASLLIIAIVSIIEFTAYKTYCLNWSALVVCHKTLFISGIPLMFFGILWFSLLVSKTLMSTFGNNKTRRW